ncbi:MAG TPA: hypothetical protein PKH00_02880 [Bacilli bacterium]|jgi:hypothetical protein|nr:hypothetical protein [Bacilli bacterium]MDD3623181.1 hypothetical protein [Bacilli bacterium]HNZ74339.1 hypothetical protein [Bacilli bacterium]HOH59186.1 hypothetical protein [Bacilli bacterium]HPA99145.1 hypothetical protein [Bacilli bacterium]
MRLENFYILIGETIEYCQRIEYDLKMIYAYMEDGSFSDNLKKVEVLPLGEIIYLIRERDKEQKLFKKADYDILFTITKRRNHIVHQCFKNYNYALTQEEQERKFEIEYKNLEAFHGRLTTLWKAIENVRYNFLSKKL